MNFNRLFRSAAAALTFGTVLTLANAAAADQTHKGKFSVSQAEAAALRKYKTGKVQGTPALENEEGKWQYAVMVKVNGKLHEVMVGADSGKIESEETVTAKEEAAEQRAEAAAKKHPKNGKSGRSHKSAKGEGKEKAEKGEGDEKGK